MRVAAEYQPARVHVRPAPQPELQLAAGRARSRRARAAARTRSRARRRRSPRRAAASPGRCRRCRRSVSWPSRRSPPTSTCQRAEVGVDVVVVPVRLVRDAVGRAEVDAARHRSTGRVVDHRHVHPVAPLLEHLDPQAVAFDRRPARGRPSGTDRPRARRRPPRPSPTGTAAICAYACGLLVVRVLAPALGRIVQVRRELAAGQPVGVAGDPAVDRHDRLVERHRRSIGGERGDADDASGLPRERVLPGAARGHRGDQHTLRARGHLDGTDRDLRPRDASSTQRK